MDCKRIMVITPHTPSLIWFRMDMMVDFLDRGYEVIAVGQEPIEKWSETFDHFGICYRSIPIVRNGMNPFRDLNTLKVIKRLYHEIKPQKVFLYQAKAVVYGSIAANHDPSIEIYSLISGLGSVFRGTSKRNYFFKRILKWEYRFALKKNTAVMFHNQDDMRQFQLWKITPDSVCRLVHGSGVNIEHFQYTKLPDVSVVFLMIARIIRDKGVIEYLEACRILKQKYPYIRCMLVGAFDSNPSALRMEEIEPYLPYIEYCGEQTDVKPFIQQCTTYVLPSYHEGLPKSVLEAMSIGRAIITTNAPGCRETVVEGENGFLVQVKNSNQLAERMEYMVLHPELQQEMGKNSRKLIEEKYDVKKVNEEIAYIMHLDRRKNGG